MEIQLWREILNPYDLAVKELTVKFEHLIQEHRQQGLYSPIEQVHGRVKTISSILDKAQKKNIPINEIEEKLEDIAGIRIICQFVEDIQKVVEIIRYRSYHMIIEYNVETMNGPKCIHAEIQIRTLAMNFWATIEHSLQYKYKKNIPDHIREKLSSAADAIIVLDQEMSQVRSEIMDAQNAFQIQANLVADILNTIQNLYQLANKREIAKIQDEFYQIYKAEDLDQLRRFQKQLDVIAEGYRAQSC